MEVIQEIVFPLCCHSAKDEELWQEDPQEFIRTKYGKATLFKFMAHSYGHLLLLQTFSMNW